MSKYIKLPICQGIIPAQEVAQRTSACCMVTVAIQFWFKPLPQQQLLLFTVPRLILLPTVSFGIVLNARLRGAGDRPGKTVAKLPLSYKIHAYSSTYIS